MEKTPGLSDSIVFREKKPKEVMGGFSRRCSKLINSCEYLETELWTCICVVPKTGEGFLAVSSEVMIPIGGKSYQESQKQLGGLCLSSPSP